MHLIPLLMTRALKLKSLSMESSKMPLSGSATLPAVPARPMAAVKARAVSQKSH